MAHACVQALLQPAAELLVGQHGLGCAFDVVHVYPATLALEPGELVQQQPAQAHQPLLVQPGLVLGAGFVQELGQFLGLAHTGDVRHFFAELARLAGLGQQSGQRAISVTRRQRLLQLAALG